MSGLPLKRRRVVYRGRVQGVGFRDTAARIARSSVIKGYVRNLADGTVELVAEGPVDRLAALLAQIERAFAGNIETQAGEELEATGSFESFEIRR